MGDKHTRHCPRSSGSAVLHGAANGMVTGGEVQKPFKRGVAKGNGVGNGNVVSVAMLGTWHGAPPV